MSSPSIAVLATSPSLEPLAQHLSGQLEAPLLPTASDVATLDCCALVVLCSPMGLQVQQVGAKAPGPVWVDFVSGAVAHRRKFGGGAGQQIAKAVGIRPGIRPRIADVTAGLGRDAFVLATLGCSVTLIERSPIVALLLADGLARGLQDAETADIVARMKLCRGDAIAWLAEQQGDQRPEVVYLDPMFPHSKKSAQVKKEMLLFRQLVGPDEDTALLLQQALAAATHRVVVKRPRIAPAIDGPPPSYSLEGKSGRFDIYALKRL